MSEITDFTNKGINDFDDNQIPITDEQDQFDEMLDSIAKRQEHDEHRNNTITLEMIENDIDQIRRFSYLIHNGTYDENIINDRVPGIIAVFNANDQPVKIFIAKINSNYGKGIVDNNESVKVILSPTELADAFILNNKIKYRTADYLQKTLQEEHPECFKFKKQNYINPAEIADPAARSIMGMDIKVTDHLDLENNFLSSCDATVPDSNEYPGIKWISEDSVYSHNGSYMGHPTQIIIYLCLTDDSLNKKNIITPDCLVECHDQVNGNISVGIFNLKTGYDRKNHQWKSDYGSITRKIKKILQDEHMTDFKQQMSNRSLNARQ